MTQFDERERAFENMYARDQEMQFKIVARRNRLLGQWAAKKMGLTEVEADAYAREVIRADFENAGDEDVVRKLLGTVIGCAALAGLSWGSDDAAKPGNNRSDTGYLDSSRCPRRLAGGK